jgi:dihydrofolate reductase
MKIKLIVAKAQNDVIGKDNDLIWHLPADMRFFSETTKGNIVLMGRRNWDSIPLKYRPLSNRINVVITRNTGFSHPDCVVFNSVEAGINHYKNHAATADDQDLYIIGGGQIYAYCMDNDLLDEMYVTFIDHTFDGDTYFPEIDESKWKKERIMHHPIDEKNKYLFEVFHYTKP